MGNNNDSTANVNLKGAKENTYDVIVIGSGISGGWAAKEFCEKRFENISTGTWKDGRTHKRLSDCYYESLGVSAQIRLLLN